MPRRRPVIRARRAPRWLPALVALGTAGCASTPETGPPLPDPSALAARLAESSGPEAPWQVRFRWEYGDPQGTLRGEGVGRINPSARFRLDFFTTGEGSMAAVLEGAELATLGQIEDVRLPAPPFMYAMAGVFRPGSPEPAAGYETDAGRVLVYETSEGTTLRFTFRDGRLHTVEERRDGRVLREISLSWADGRGPWPAEAEYRDRPTPSRVRWVLEEAEEKETPYPDDIYDLGDAPPP